MGGSLLEPELTAWLLLGGAWTKSTVWNHFLAPDLGAEKRTPFSDRFQGAPTVGAPSFRPRFQVHFLGPDLGPRIVAPQIAIMWRMVSFSVMVSHLVSVG